MDCDLYPYNHLIVLQLELLQTCIVKRFVENAFHGNQYNPTPGVDFASRRLTIKPLGTATLIIIDIGGSAINSKMLNIYLNAGVDVRLLVSTTE